MCGIAGVITESQHGTFDNKKILSVMIESLLHRGPDSRGIESFRQNAWEIGLGHTRLSILDLSKAGCQPMSIDQGLKIVYNGEIYNFLKLRTDLSTNVAEWKSRTDTEVILQSYKKWGVHVLKQFRGMFAFALLDSENSQLLLARDPLGIKPLYYFHDGNTFLFASEVRSLLDTGLVPRRLSQEGLLSYLQYGSIETPLTVIEGIRSVLPGHYLLIDLKNETLQIKEIPYDSDVFSPLSSHSFSNDKEAKEKLYDLLKESIELHLVSDVPIGVFLSGGIDSSAIVALMRQVTDERPKTFSVVFDEEKFSEAAYARLIAQKYKTEHHEISLSENALLEILPHALRAMDQPTMDGINTYVVAKAVKDSGIKVALSGLGGDELFAGYPSFSRARLLKRFTKIPHALRLAVSRVGCKVLNDSPSQKKFWKLVESDGSARSAYEVSRQLFASDEIQVLLGEKISSSTEFQFEYPMDIIREVSMLELQGYMANTLLRDTDCMSMAHALEVRVPFLDPVLVRFVLGLPAYWKIDGKRPKPLLLDAIDGLLPEEIWRRPKKGFTLPFERWMRTSLRPELDEVLSNGKNLRALGFNSEFVQKIWRNFQELPRKERWSRSWSLYVLKKWCEFNHIAL